VRGAAPRWRASDVGSNSTSSLRRTRASNPTLDGFPQVRPDPKGFLAPRRSFRGRDLRPCGRRTTTKFEGETMRRPPNSINGRRQPAGKGHPGPCKIRMCGTAWRGAAIRRRRQKKAGAKCPLVGGDGSGRKRGKFVPGSTRSSQGKVRMATTNKKGVWEFSIDEPRTTTVF